VVGREAGPTLVCVGGIHGNEPAGVVGLETVLRAMEADQMPVRGEFLALSGNRTALFERRRFIDRDLNRAWTEDQVRRLEQTGFEPASAEDREQAELLAAINEARARARGPLFVLDLHTTSGAGGVFSTMSDRLPNRAFGRALPLPVVLGLEEQVDGTLMDYLDREGLTAISVECGQHEEDQAADRAEAVVWLALAHAGLIAPDGPRVLASHARLEEEFSAHPRVSEIRYRYPVSEPAEFRMLEGYRNFQPIRSGEVLAHDAGANVRAPMDGRMLMPLYQEQGDDGFFLIREFSAFWLSVSARLRHWRLERFVHWLPGIKRVRARPDVLYVNRTVARWYALELLHLLGYRRVREGGRRLLVIMRGRGPS